MNQATKKEEDREGFATVELTMSEEEWAEVYYAVDSKLANMENGVYDGIEEEVNVETWKNTLQRVKMKLGMALEQKGVEY